MSNATNFTRCSLSLFQTSTLDIWGGFSFATGAVGIDLFPTTSAVLRGVAGFYSLFVLMIVFYYAGELVHRERQTG